MNKFFLIPFIAVPTLVQHPCNGGVARDVSKILLGAALIYTAYVCFGQARTAANNLAADPVFIGEIRENPLTRKLLEMLPEKTAGGLLKSFLNQTKIALSDETTEMRIGKLCGWSAATGCFAYCGLTGFLSGIRGECAS
jgi:methyl coenzyme M reductase alpha subunit